jgi:hypothetical protein
LHAALDSFLGNKIYSRSEQLTTFADTGNKPEARRECQNLNPQQMYATHHVSFLVLPNNSSWFYDALVVNKSSTDTFGFGEFAELEVAPKFVDFIFDIGVEACGS